MVKGTTNTNTYFLKIRNNQIKYMLTILKSQIPKDISNKKDINKRMGISNLKFDQVGARRMCQSM